MNARRAMDITTPAGMRVRLAVSLLVGLLLVAAQTSPAGAAPRDRLIVFQSNRGGRLDLWTMRPDGTGATKVTDDPTDDVIPSGHRTARRSPGPGAGPARTARSG